MVIVDIGAIGQGNMSEGCRNLVLMRVFACFVSIPEFSMNSIDFVTI